MIEYAITRFDLDAHEYHIRMRIGDDGATSRILRLPAWIPGSYMIRDFARNVTSIRATDDSGPVAIRKRDKQTWELTHTNGDLVVEYQVYAFDLSVRSAFLDRSRAFFNGTSLFFSVDGSIDAVWSLTLAQPDSRAAASWRLATTLPARDIDGDGFGCYLGEGIDLLYDCPVEIGEFERLEFSSAGIAHQMVITDGGTFDGARISTDLAMVCAEHAAMFEELPVERYLFLTLATADGYGGLEHRDSTSLVCKRSDLPAVGLGKPDKGYRQFLGLCSHEYFHLWNVKRIRPQVFADADLSTEVHTELLWAFEGITSYYDELALARSGVLDAEDYLDLFATTATRVLRGAGRLRQSVADSSFDAWTRFYKQDENAPNAIVSYYAKGALVAFGLDVAIRMRSADTLSLDDLMRALWRRYARIGVGIPERGIEAVVAEMVGESFDDFFARYVYGTEELPLDEWFGSVGVGYRVRAANGLEDLGGMHTELLPEAASRRALGARTDNRPEGVFVTHVLAQGAAQAAGLSAGDLLVAIEGERVTAANLDELLQRAVGTSVEIHYFRRNQLVVDQLPLSVAPPDTCDLWLLEQAEISPAVHERRVAWLRSHVVKEE